MTKLLLALAMTAFAKENKPMEWKGQFGGIDKPGHRVVVDQEGWKKLWADIGKPAPEADLEKHVAVAVFFGTRNTGGYSAAFKEIKVGKDRAVLKYSIKPPKGMAMQALTQPWHVRLFDKPAKPLTVIAE